MPPPRTTRRQPPERPAAGPSSLPAIRVAVLEGRDAGQFAPLLDREGARVAVGTARDNALVLHDERVSPRHLEVWTAADGIGVRDAGSATGTWLGAARIVEAVVPVGTRLRVGDTMLGLSGAAALPDLSARLAAEGLVFRGAAMGELAEILARLSPLSATVLVEGETGTGKEVVARAVHRLSMRSNGPFVVVDCGALPPSLLESELFGHERGAFTGAERRRQGAFERAHGGTLLLDEIGELPLASQPALLGALQRRRFQRVGGHTEVEVDVRIVAATNRDLLTEVERGAFRADLYYRLATARLVLPPLRRRLEDLPLLIEHLLVELTGAAGGLRFDERDLAALRGHPWKGNVRELRSVVERALAIGRLQLDLPEGRGPQPATPAAEPAGDEGIPSYRDARAEAIAGFTQGYLGRLIEASGGNASEAARVARMDRPHLLRLLRLHGLR